MPGNEHQGALDSLHKFTVWVGVLALIGGANLLLAFPFKWCWNYGMTHTFGLPEIGWAHAFCLLWVLTHLRTLQPKS